MEQKTKKCPYCGEEILAVAKKCKHCGEWLTTKTDKHTSHTVQSMSQKDKTLNSHYLLDKQWMNILFWITIITALITEIYQYDNDKEITIFEIVGLTVLFICDLLFLFLLMRAIPHINRLLNLSFIVCFALNFFLCLVILTLFSTSIYSENGYVLFTFLAFTSYIITALIGLQLMFNYEGMIKQIGLIIIAYNIVSLVWGLVEDRISNNIASIFTLVLDFLYYRYMTNRLSKN